MQNKAKTLTVISALAFIMSFNVLPVSADEGQDIGESVSTEQIDTTHTEGYVKINCENIPGEISWRIYRVGLRSDDTENEYEYALDDKFAGLTTDDKFTFTSKTTSREIEALTKSLVDKIKSDSIETDYTVHCVNGGIAECKLPYGLYLFVADGYADYPVLTAVKDWNEVLTVNPKFTVTSDSSSHTDSVPTIDNGGGGTSGGGGFGNVTGGSTGGSSVSTGGGDTTSAATTTEVVTETTTETTGTPTPAPSDNSPNPHTAGIVKTATGSTLLLAAAGVGSMIGRKRRKDDDND